MSPLIIYLLTFLGCIAYIFIAGMYLVVLRAQDYSRYNPGGLSYATMEKSEPSRAMDHAVALQWPVVTLIIGIYLIFEHIFRRKNETAHL